LGTYAWITERRKELDINQDDLANRLRPYGINVTRATISHWEKGRYKPPFDEPTFTEAMANALEMDVRSVLINLGYNFVEHPAETVEKAVSIIERMSPDRQKRALQMLELLAKDS
jgi:DNA-binding XRE family transcriptional regulator